jgi:hypothetical protein
MTAKEKAEELVSKFFNVFIEDEDEHYEETAWRLSKELAIVEVGEMISMLPFTDTNTYIGKWCERERNFLNEVKEEIRNLKWKMR